MASRGPEVLQLLSSGALDPLRVQTEVLPFDTAAEALPTAGFKPVFVRGAAAQDAANAPPAP